jgi:DNA polymerase (family X)
MGKTAARTKSLDASGVARLLTEYGQRLELAGENPYRARAYYKAAESLGALTAPLADIVAEDRLRDIPGIGPAIAARIRALHETGTDPALEEMRRQVPAGVLAMLGIPDIRTRDVLRIHKELDVSSLTELENACRLDLLKDRKGLGAALQKKVLDGLALMRRSRGQMLLHRASERLEAAIANLRRSHRDLTRIVAAGDARRGCEVVGDLSIVACGRDDAEGPVRLGQGIALHVAEPALYGVALLRATGSAAHLRDLEAFAAGRGFALDDNGLRRGRHAIPCPEEANVYAALGLPFIAPELREGRGEIELAAAGRLPKLVAAEDLAGLLHSHTTLSDGSHTLQQMAEATRRRGYAYFGVADHSRSAAYAGGLTIEEIEAQHAEIDRLNARSGEKFRIFKGIESDILADGSLDYPDDILAGFDFVVASVHSRFRIDEATQTERIIRAVANPHTTILGHMTGRMLLRRPGYEVDVDQILKACAAHGVAVEINGNPHRLDLDWRWHARALELGCMMSINPDAHSIAELDLTHWGVLQARKGGVPKERVLNCMSLAAITRFFAGRARSRGAGAQRIRQPPRPVSRKSARPQARKTR